MSDRMPRRQALQVADRRSRQAHHHRQSSQPTTRRRAPSIRPSSRPSSQPLRYRSEPSLWSSHADDDGQARLISPPSDSVLFRPNTCADIFSYPLFFPQLSPSPNNYETYSRESKVVVNVTVEGSPGPIQAMVKLGSSVDETIRLVVNKYGEEGRSPTLERGSEASYQLHHSPFSLQGLRRSDVIGDVGSRSFYLRTSSASDGGGGQLGVGSPDSAHMDLRVRRRRRWRWLFFSIAVFMERSMGKIVRRTRKLWKVLGCACIQCG